MEEEEPPQPISDETTNNTTADVFISSSVDTSRPFTSVKEAVAIFGDRLLSASASASPKPSLVSSSPNAYSIPIQRDPSRRLSSPIMKPIKRSEDEEEETKEEGGVVVVLDTLRKLEAELEKTKAELKLLKERGTETEVALATLNAQLHKNMSKLAQAEATAAGKAAAASKTVRFEINQEGGVDDDGDDINNKKEKKMKEYITRRMDESKTLAHILSLGENDHLLKYNKKLHHHHHKMSLRKKHKPIIPLVGDYFLFFKRKPPSPTNHHI